MHIHITYTACSSLLLGSKMEIKEGKKKLTDQLGLGREPRRGRANWAGPQFSVTYLKAPTHYSTVCLREAVKKPLSLKKRVNERRKEEGNEGGKEEKKG